MDDDMSGEPGYDRIPDEAYAADFERLTQAVDDNVVSFPARRDRVSGPVREEGVNLADFHAYMPAGNFIFAPSREFWPASSVNHRVPPQKLLDKRGDPVRRDGELVYISASAWLAKERAVEQMTWAPGEPMIVEDRLISDGGWIKRVGCSCFNLYRPPVRVPGDASLAAPWIEHVHHVYPQDAAHIIAWLAQRVQRPDEKINHALVLGGNQGIGKDTLLEPVKQAVGPWNVSEVSPQQVLGRFNGFLKSVILRVSEARDLGEVDRYSFYEHMKTYTAAPPDVLRVDEKHVREHSIFNVTGVIFTTNNKNDGLYIPPDDRRHYVAWTDLNKDDFDEEYWTTLYGWYGRGGIGHVAEYLRTLDVSWFNPKAPPPKTQAWHDIVSANRAPEDAELGDALDDIGWPDAVTIAGLMASTSCAPSFSAFLSDRRNSRKIPHRLEAVGYVSVKNPHTESGLWKVEGKRQAIYAKKGMPVRERIAAAEALLPAWAQSRG